LTSTTITQNKQMNTIIILAVVGAVLIFLETLLPGMVAGIAGLLCLAAGVFLGYHDFGLQTGTLILVGVVIGLLVAAAFWAKFFPDSRIARLYISRQTVGDAGAGQSDLLSRTGVAITQLRPSGAAFINGKRVDVITEGMLIEPGAAIKVVEVEGIRVVVRPM